MQRETHEIEAAEEHSELLAKNIFAVTMVGAVGFFAACFWVMF